MKNTRVFFIHTVNSVVPVFNELASKHLHETRITHIVDESLIQQALEAGGLTPLIMRIFCGHVMASADAGADVIQCTCSSMSPAVVLSRNLVSIPVLTIDEPVVRALVRRHRRIGVIATAISTLNPSVDLVRAAAADLGFTVKVIPVFCEGAYDALFAGNIKKHDSIVHAHLLSLIKRVDAVLLAQASMARIAAQDGIPRLAPIFTSPEPAIRHLARMVRRIKKRLGG
jgi:hypothetical protein